ncbi:MAG: zf-HC2 domain-containing protein [Planctomycetota bacterium]
MASVTMSCAEVEPLLPLVADGSVDPDADPGLFAHLASCPSCQQRMAEHDLVTIALERGARTTTTAPQRTNILRLWLPIAAAASLVIVGTVMWRLGDAHDFARDRAVPQVATPLAVPTTSVSATDKPEVLRFTRADGSVWYLVRRHDTWQQVDPAAIDGSDAGKQSSGLGTPVKY